MTVTVSHMEGNRKKKENETAGRPQDLVKHYVASSHNQPSSLSLSLFRIAKKKKKKKQENILTC